MPQGNGENDMKGRNEIAAGIFVGVGLLLFFLSIFVLGKEREIFSSQEEYFTTFKDVKGLSEGAPVRLGGITIGRVSLITFSDNFKDPDVQIEMLINEKYLERIRQDSVVFLETQGLLGDRFLSISAGKEQLVLPGNKLKSSEPGDFGAILNKASVFVDNATEISSELKSFIKDSNSPGQSPLKESIQGLASIVKEVEKGKGPLHRLIFSDPKGEDPLAHITEAAKNLSEVTRRANSDDLDKILTNLKETSNNLKVVTNALANGGGTLGALLVDSKLYDNLIEVTDGAKRSFILRHAIRSSMKEKKE